MNSRVIVFCDGASKGNPGPGGWGVVTVEPDGLVTELGGAALHTTNNRMELTAAIHGLESAQAVVAPMDVYTDSTYVIKGIREWIWAWRRRGWKTAEGNDVLNRDLWERLAALADARGTRSIAWHYVRGHVGTPGNERVDEIADGLATGKRVELYRGPLTTYPISILDVPDDTAVPARTATARSAAKAKAYSYLSLVHGKPMRHTTWAECERRVKGQSAAKFKKSTSADDEAAILRAWRVDPKSLDVS